MLNGVINLIEKKKKWIKFYFKKKDKEKKNKENENDKNFKRQNKPLANESVVDVFHLFFF